MLQLLLKTPIQKALLKTLNASWYAWLVDVFFGGKNLLNWQYPQFEHVFYAKIISLQVIFKLSFPLVKPVALTLLVEKEV